MEKKKVTLSVNPKIYNDFQKYCEENGLLLSKKFELYMKNILKGKKILALFFAMAFVIMSAYALTFSNGFASGTFENTAYNGSAVILAGSNLSGNFTSQIFDAGGLARWNNISAVYSQPSKDFLFSIDNVAVVWNSYNGTNWTLIKDDYNNGDGNGITGTAFDSNRNYFAVYLQNVWKSTDLGVTWAKVKDNYNGAESNNAISFAIDRNNGLYIIEGDEDVWKSSDSGVTWTKVATNFNGATGNVLGFVVNSSNGFIATDVVSDVWTSTDNGTTWAKVNDDYNNGAANGLNAMAVDSLNNVYILDNQDVWKSSDSGVTWTKVNDDINGAGDSNSGLAIATDSLNNVYAIDGSEDVFYSNDYGATFTKIADNFNGANGGAQTLSSAKLYSNITFQARNCSSSDCADGTWQAISLNNVNLTGRYFQYKAFMTRENAGVNPALYNVSLDYSSTPVISSLSLTTTAPSKNDTSQNLTAIWAATDADNDSLFNITDWRINGNSIALLNLPFEAGSSNSTYTKDYSSYGNNINVSGATFNATGGYSGGGYFFNADDLITINNGFDYSQGAITFWINEKASATSNSMGIFTKLGNPVYMSDIVTAILSTTVANSAYLSFGVYNNNGVGANGYAWRYDSLNFYNTGWHHVAIQANSSGNEVYIDGQKVSPTYTSGNSSSIGWLDYPAGNTNFRLGCRMGGLSCLYWLDNAMIDDFRIYNITLSAQQVSAIYKNRTDLIVSQQLAVGQNWSYCLTVSDRTDVSSTNCSNSVTIRSSDTIPPIITIISPENRTYASNSVFLNYTAADGSAVSSCWYSIDSSPNITLTGCSTATISGLNDGSHALMVYANDTLGNTNSSSTTFSVDTTSPSWSNIRTSVPSAYSSANSYFNITWADGSGISSVLFESNFSGIAVNYSMQLLSGNIYGFNAVIPAGTFYWKSYSNDSAGNMNSSDVQIFTIAKAGNPVNLYLNGNQANLSISYGTTSNANAISAAGTVSLYRDGIAVSNPDTGILGAGSYNYTAISSGNQNYTENSTTLFLNVGKATPSLSLLIDGIASDKTKVYGADANVSASEGNSGDADVVYSLYRDGIAVSNPDTGILGAGSYNYTYIAGEGQNYTSASSTLILNITRKSPVLELKLNGIDSDLSTNILTDVTINASVLSGVGDIRLYEDSSLILEGSNIGIIKNYSTVGVRVWKVNISQSQNYTSSEKTHSISVVDSNSPQFSNIKTSPNSPAVYSSGRNYQFNISWTHPIGIDNVILEFNNINYSYNSGQVQKNGDEYYISLSSLGSGSYSYKWYANSTSGNSGSTTTQSYSIDRAIAALFLTVTPSSSISYGTAMSVSCSANNVESSPALTRNTITASNPDTSILGVGTYNYACTAVTTQNYTSASATGSLIISKASPSLELRLNGQETDVAFGSSGGIVNASSRIISPENASVNLSIDGINVASGNGAVENVSSVTGAGTHTIIVSFSGNDNYTSGNLTRRAIVSQPDSGGSSGGSGSGGGGGGGLPATKEETVAAGTAGIDIKDISDIIANEGERKKLSIQVKNNGTNFLNNCKLKGIGLYSFWMSSEETKKLGAGEESEFILLLNIPKQVRAGTYGLSFNVECDELQSSKDFNVEVFERKLEIGIIKTERDEENNLKISYYIKELAGIGQNVNIEFVLMSGNDRISDFAGTEEIGANERKEFEATIPVKRSLEGNFNLLININSEKYSSFQQEGVVLSKGVSGFSVFNFGNDNKTFTLGVFVVFGIFAIFMIARIFKLRKEYRKHKRLSRSVKIATVKIK